MPLTPLASDARKKLVDRLLGPAEELLKTGKQAEADAAVDSALKRIEAARPQSPLAKLRAAIPSDLPSVAAAPPTKVPPPAPSVGDLVRAAGLSRSLLRRYPKLREGLSYFLAPVKSELTAGRISELVRLADESVRATGHALRDLPAAAVDSIVNTVRSRLVADLPEIRALVATAENDAKAVGVSKVGVRLTDATSGWWVTISGRDSAGAEVIVHERYLARDAVPAAPPLVRPEGARPASGGWLRDGKVVTDAPVPIQGLVTPLAVTATLIRDAPSAVVEQMRRASRRVENRFEPFGSALPVFGEKIATADQRAVGLGGINVVRAHIPDLTVAQGGAYDIAYEVTGAVRAGTGERFGLEDALPLPKEVGLDQSSVRKALGIADENMGRLHLWGPGFGDELGTAIAYGPLTFNAFQNETIEAFLRQSGTNWVPATIVGRFKRIVLNGKDYLYGLEYEYRFTMPDNSIHAFQLWHEGGKAHVSGR